MFRKVAAFIALSSFLLFNFCVQAKDEAKTLTLDEAISTALKNNPSLEAMVKSVQESQYMHSAASKEWLPTLSMDYGFTVFVKKPYMYDTSSGEKFALADYTSYLWGTHVKMPLYTAGVIQYKESIERLGIDISRLRFLEAKADLVQEVTINYFNVLRLQKNLTAVKENLNRYQRHEVLTQEYFNVGLVPKNSFLEIQAKRASTRQDEIVVNKDLKLAEAALCVSMGIDIDAHFKLVDDFSFRAPPYSLDDCFGIAKKQNPSYVAFTYLQKRAQAVMSLEKTESRPKLFAKFSFYKHGKTPALKGDDYVTNDNLTGQIVGEWDVFDWFKTRDRANARKMELEKLIAEQKSASNKISLDIRESYLTLVAARDKFAAVKLEKKFAQENYRVAKLRYKERMAKPTEVNDALVLLRQAEFSYSMAAFEYNVALARLLRVTGANVNLEEDCSKTKREKNG
jgi:outer membrane protein TolC